MSKFEEIAKSLVENVKSHIQSYVDPKFKALEESIKAIPAPEKGDKGDSVDMEEVLKYIAQEIAKQCAAIKIPEPEIPDVASLVSDEVKKQVGSIEIPKPKDGEDGKDALELNILPQIDQDKSYPRNTYAMHNGGLWRSHEKTSGMRGWECVVDGISQINVEQDLENERSFTIKAVKSSGDETKQVFNIPAQIYRGVHEIGKTYRKGDTVTWNGSIWTCKEDTEEAPNSASKLWTLSVKAGRNANQPVRVKP